MTRLATNHRRTANAAARRELRSPLPYRLWPEVKHSRVGHLVQELKSRICIAYERDRPSNLVGYQLERTEGASWLQKEMIPPTCLTHFSCPDNYDDDYWP